MSTHAARTAAPPTGVFYVIATPIGNLEDISLRAQRLLAEVDHVFCEDTRHSGRLLAELGVKTPRHSLHEHNERDRVEFVLARLQVGESCALISDAGTPLINDPGFVLVRALRDAGVRVVPVPGASAVTAVLSAAGLPTDRFSYEGFLPAKQKARRERLATLSADARTLVFYEAPHRLQEMLADAALAFGKERIACVAREVTKLHEEFRNGTLRQLMEWAQRDPNACRGEIVVVIGGAPEDQPAFAADIDGVLKALLDELPASKAAKVAARLTGEKRQDLYQRAMTLSGEATD